MSDHNPQRGLGTLIRHVLELLDGDLEHVYKEAGLEYRPKYTPVLQALIRSGPASIQNLAAEAMITHSAASQTISQMVRDQLVYLKPGQDGRERIVHIAPRTGKMLPKLRALWEATSAAAAGLNAELPFPLDQIIIQTITALERQPFSQRIAEAATPRAPRRPAVEGRASA